MEPTTFGTLLKRYRMTAGLTQEALAERASLSTRAVSDLERGLSRAPRYDTLDLLTKAMNLDAEQRAALFAAARPALPQEDAKAAPLQVLPFPPTALLGREQEIAQALGFLGEGGVRLLTVTGPGGVGKTRLALELAHTLRVSFVDGIAWIDLTVLHDPSLVPQTVAQALGLREQADRPFSEQVRAFLQDKQYLLLLDNFEQVLEAADFVADLLVSCPRLQVLVTSRSPLHLRAEQLLVLTPLTQAAAVTLFRERAQRVQPHLDATEPTVVAICQQVDRLPLAIELAAAHVRVLSLPVLLERLSDRLRFLRGDTRDLPERQQTMQEAIAWSYHLLSPPHQRWFRRLSIFMGGYTLAAAESICRGEEPTPSDEGLATIAALVDASLVQVETTADGLPRYRLLEVIREYAAEQLRVAEEEDSYQRRHAEYYAGLAEEAERIGSGQGRREAHLEGESANGRAALRWAYERREVTLGLRLATWFGRFWMTRGQMSEGNLWLSRMLALDEALGAQGALPAVRSKALYHAAHFTMHLGRRDRAFALAEEALAQARRTGDQTDISNALALLGSIALARGAEEEAATYFMESYVAAQRAKDAGDPHQISLALLNLGELARKQGDVARATEYLEEALSNVRAIDMTWGIANILTMLGHLARGQQDYERAKVRYRESLALYHRLGNATYTAWCLEGIAAVACAQGSYQHTTRLCAAAAVLRLAAQTPLPPTEQDDFDKVVMTARAELDERAFTEQWRIGSTMTQDDVFPYALTGPLA
jgi:predicted ATPase/DNA-binding XRE family transcriptional regulator/Tfp pilus assembly protein PilF